MRFLICVLLLIAYVVIAVFIAGMLNAVERNRHTLQTPKQIFFISATWIVSFPAFIVWGIYDWLHNKLRKVVQPIFNAGFNTIIRLEEWSKKRA